MLFRQNLRTGNVEALSARRDKSHSPPVVQAGSWDNQTQLVSGHE